MCFKDLSLDKSAFFHSKAASLMASFSVIASYKGTGTWITSFKRCTAYNSAHICITWSKKTLFFGTLSKRVSLNTNSAGSTGSTVPDSRRILAPVETVGLYLAPISELWLAFVSGLLAPVVRPLNKGKLLLNKGVEEFSIPGLRKHSLAFAGILEVLELLCQQ